MNMYFYIKATVPTNVKGGVRKIKLDIMPDYMAYVDATYDKNDIDDGMILTMNEQGYQKGYDPKVAKALFHEIYAKAIDFDFIMLFKKDPKTGRLEQIDSQQF